MTATPRDLEAWLAWYRDMGADEAIGEHPIDRFRSQTGASPADAVAEAAVLAPPLQHRVAPTSSVPARGVAASAREVAAACGSLIELEKALSDFEGCALKETAINLCFADGGPDAPLMMIGEAPGAEEDRQGKPFVGPSGRLLDRMLASIGLTRADVYITNIIYWRPPGNRPPTAAEVATCQPFLERQIELLRPKVLVFLGGAAARALLGLNEGVTKLRGRRFFYSLASGDNITALVTFHPAYLLRQPAQKRLAWRDLMAIRRLLPTNS